ncbi:MAG: hydrolase [Anaerovoracaceae bacterium]|nr:hydrolase [Anaerovoracaceae bacterium]
MSDMIRREEAAVIAIDFQTNIIKAMHEKEELADCAARLFEGAKALGVPVLVTQQYTKGLGETVPEIAQAIGDFEHVEKTTFSALKTPEFKERLEASGKKQVILTGIEAHVCVQQTALELLDAGYDVFVLSDCISSRKKKDKKEAERRMVHAGCVLTTYEAALFEMLDGSKSDGFKEISKIVK